MQKIVVGSQRILSLIFKSLLLFSIYLLKRKTLTATDQLLPRKSQTNIFAACTAVRGMLNFYLPYIRTAVRVRQNFFLIAPPQVTYDGLTAIFFIILLYISYYHIHLVI